jgi:hypothetical protein
VLLLEKNLQLAWILHESHSVLETRPSTDGFPLPLFQDENRDDHGYRGGGESGVEVDYPEGMGGNAGKWNGLVAYRVEIAIIAIEVVSAFSCVPAYVPAWSYPVWKPPSGPRERKRFASSS